MKNEKYFWRIGTAIAVSIAAVVIPEPNIRESIFLWANNANAAGPEGCLNSNGVTCHPENTTTGSGWYCGRDAQGRLELSREGYEPRIAQQCFLNGSSNRSDISPASTATPISIATPIRLSSQPSTTITSCHPEFQYVDEKGQKSEAQFEVIIPVGKSSHGFRCNPNGSISPESQIQPENQPIPTVPPENPNNAGKTDNGQTLARNPNHPYGGRIYAYPVNYKGNITFIGTLMCLRDKLKQTLSRPNFITTANCLPIP